LKTWIINLNQWFLGKNQQGESKMRDTIIFLVNKKIFCLLLILLSGCASSPQPRFYQLSPISNGTEIGHSDTPCVSVGIGPVKLPEYTNRPQIVTRKSENELSRAQFDQWAEPLSDTFSRVIAENLSRLLCVDRVYLFPWEATIKPDYLVRADVLEMNGYLDTKAYLQLQWSIWGVREKKELFQKRSAYSELVRNGSYEGLVQAYSNMVGQLSRDIARAIEGL
jgi:uncharacterized protein